MIHILLLNSFRELWNSCFYPHFTHKETEAQTGEATSLVTEVVGRAWEPTYPRSQQNIISLASPQ